MRVGLGSAPSSSFLCHHLHPTAAVILYTTPSMFLRVCYFTSDSFFDFLGTCAIPFDKMVLVGWYLVFSVGGQR